MKITITNANPNMWYSGSLNTQYEIDGIIVRDAGIVYAADCKISNESDDFRKTITTRLQEIKLQESNFATDWWKNNYFADTDITGKENPSKHISQVDFEKLNPADLVRCFGYVLLRREAVSSRRVSEQYFDARKNK